MKKWLAVALIFLSVEVFAQGAPAETYLTADALLDVETGKLIKNPALVIRDGRILAIGQHGKLKFSKSAEIIDLKGRTLLPGLMDMHVHLQTDPETPFYERLRFSIPR